MSLFSRRSFLTTASFVAALACSACSSQSGETREVMVPFSTAPVAVQRTIVQEIPDQKIDMVELETKDGVEIYEAKSVHADGSKQVVKTDRDGKLLSVKNKSAQMDVPWTKVPKAVRKTIAKNNGGHKVDVVSKEKCNGSTVYLAHTTTPSGVTKTIKVSKTGKLIEPKMDSKQ